MAVTKPYTILYVFVTLLYNVTHMVIMYHIQSRYTGMYKMKELGRGDTSIDSARSTVTKAYMYMYTTLYHQDYNYIPFQHSSPLSAIN